MGTTNKKKDRGGNGGHKGTTGRATTPTGRRPILKLNLKPRPAVNTVKDSGCTKTDLFISLQENASTEVEEPTSSLNPATVTTRHGRQVRRPQTADDIYGSDFDRLLEDSSIQKPDDDDDYDAGTADVPISRLQQNRKSGRQSKNAPFQSGLHKVGDEEDFLSSATIGQSPPQSLQAANIFQAEIHSDVYLIMNHLCSEPKIQIDLPTLVYDKDSSKRNDERPYSAKLLMHLYLLCYSSQRWNLCDLVADTWIRAFHDLRKRGEKDVMQQAWRPNTALQKRKRQLKEQARSLKKMGGKTPSGVGFAPNPPDYGLIVADPALSADVTYFDSALLNELYEYTPMNCGARHIWADAMALGGDKTEHELGDTVKHGTEWHPDLLFNIMQTSLRLVRKKLTLKIEESTEGSWCKRYHEHRNHGLPCYRKLAKDEEDRSGKIE